MSAEHTNPMTPPASGRDASARREEAGGPPTCLKIPPGATVVVINADHLIPRGLGGMDGTVTAVRADGGIEVRLHGIEHRRLPAIVVPPEHLWVPPSTGHGFLMKAFLPDSEEGPVFTDRFRAYLKMLVRRISKLPQTCPQVRKDMLTVHSYLRQIVKLFATYWVTHLEHMALEEGRGPFSEYVAQRPAGAEVRLTCMITIVGIKLIFDHLCSIEKAQHRGAADRQHIRAPPIFRESDGGSLIPPSMVALVLPGDSFREERRLVEVCTALGRGTTAVVVQIVELQSTPFADTWCSVKRTAALGAIPSPHAQPLLGDKRVIRPETDLNLLLQDFLGEAGYAAYANSLDNRICHCSAKACPKKYFSRAIRRSVESSDVSDDHPRAAEVGALRADIAKHHVSKLYLCSRCGIARYCGPDCQKAHWEKHKPICRRFRKITGILATLRRGGSVVGMRFPQYDPSV